MRIGTKSVLFGAHCFLLHPWFVAWGWWRLYGFPWDPRLWVAFFVHDLGYFGKPNMDGPEGETHSLLGAKIMSKLFDSKQSQKLTLIQYKHKDKYGFPRMWLMEWLGPWGHFSLYHSRFLAKSNKTNPSRLCLADKLSITLTPAWLYLPMVNLTGEIHEYMKMASGKEGGKYSTMNVWSSDQLQWYRNMGKYLRDWVDEHKDGRDDSWTPDVRKAQDDSGVWT